MYTKDDVLSYVDQEGVKFIRLAFFDVFGNQKNVSIMPGQLAKAFDKGIAVDSTEIVGFGQDVYEDLFLKPDPSTMALLPWRSSENGVILMICSIYKGDGTLFEADPRAVLKKSLIKAMKAGLDPSMAAKFEFYLFELNDRGYPTKVPFDQGTYMDVAPMDRGENVRREICLTMEEMGLEPHKSYHQSGPGQNEIDFHFADALSAADDSSIFKWIVRTTAHASGLYADFSPKPLADKPGNGLHVQIRLRDLEEEKFHSFLAGILEYVPQGILFCCPTYSSYKRLGMHKAPDRADWSDTKRNVFLRIPVLNKDVMELRLPDSQANPYLVFSLLIEAGLKGMEENRMLFDNGRPAPLAASLEEAKNAAAGSQFLQEVFPESILRAYQEM